MEDGRILDSQITGSSFYNNTSRYHLARLNNKKTTHHSGAWRPKDSDSNEWLKIDFLTSTLITNILTQGEEGSLNYVEKFTVSISNNGILFHPYKEDGQIKVN